MWTASEIEQWPVEKLIPHARNARTHSDAQVGQIAASIREFGFTNPVLVGSDGGIVAGHGRLLAARKLQMPMVPVVVLGHLSDVERRLLMLADNKVSQNAGWDEDILKAEFEALLSEGAQLEVTGFSSDEVDAFMAEAGALKGETDEDAAPEEVPEISQTGDVWRCGEHVIGCLDCTKPESYEAVMGTEQATMMFTDPPYNIGMGDPSKTLVQKYRKEKRRIQNDNLGEDFGAFLRSWLPFALGKCEGACYIAMSIQEMTTLYQAFVDSGGEFKAWIIWVKSSPSLSNADYQYQYEPFLYGWRKGVKRYWCGARDEKNVWNFNRPSASKLHPTMKPVELVEKAVANSSRVGDLVLDPFGGSGTTMIACEKRNRKARLLEIDPHYVDVSVRRWCEYSGKEAVRVSDGALFSDAMMRAAQ